MVALGKFAAVHSMLAFSFLEFFPTAICTSSSSIFLSLLPTGTFRNQAKILLCHLLQQEHVWTGESEELSVQIELNKRRGWKCGRGFGLLMVGYRVQHHPARQVSVWLRAPSRKVLLQFRKHFQEPTQITKRNTTLVCGLE